jgi:predicted lipid-binding transport protein (Tim44 family)
MEIIIIIAVIVGVGVIYFLSRKPEAAPGSASAPYKVEEMVAPVVEAPAKAAPAKRAPAKKPAAKKAPARKTAAKKPATK